MPTVKSGQNQAEKAILTHLLTAATQVNSDHDKINKKLITNTIFESAYQLILERG